jgi:DNA-binding transcriptional MerR regulator
MPTGSSTDECDELSVEQLSRRTGMTVRNIRAHQSRHLLHAPRRIGRRSLYDSTHVRRIQLIQRLQAAGFTLAAVRALVTAGEAASEQALAWRAEAVALRYVPQNLELSGGLTLDADAVAALSTQQGGLETLEQYGFLQRTAEGGWRGTHPVLAAAGRSARLAGVSGDEIIRAQVAVARHCEAAAREYITIFTRHFWQPAAGEGADREAAAERMRQAHEILEPLATAVVTATFEVTMARMLRGVFGVEPAPQN